MTKIKRFDVVSILAGIPGTAVPKGALATVLDIYTDPELGYEVDVVDSEGRTLYVGAAGPSQLELVERIPGP